jgi:CHAT domain-containing protein
MKAHKNRKFSLIISLFLAATVSPVFAQSTPELIQQAKTNYQQQNYAESAQLWQKIADNLAKQGDLYNQAIALSNLSLTHQNMGNWQQAKENIETSINLLENFPKDAKNLEVLAKSLDIKGKLQLDIGESENAAETWKKAEGIYREINQEEGIIQSQINQAQAMQDLGLYPRACKTILQALSINAETCNITQKDFDSIFLTPLSSVKIRGLIGLANLFRLTGNLNSSEIILTKILESNSEIDPEDKNQIYLSLGNTQKAIKKNLDSLENSKKPSKPYLEKALNNYEKAAEFNVFTTKSQALLNEFNFLIESQKWQSAKNLLPEILQDIQKMPLSRSRIYAQISTAKNLVCLHQENLSCFQYDVYTSVDNSDSIEMLNQAIAESQKLKNKRAESLAIGALGRIYELQNNPNKAIEETEKALKIARQIQSNELAYQGHWQLARLLKNQDKAQAIQYYEQAYTILNQLRGDLVSLSPDVQFSFKETVEPVYREYVDILLKQNPSQEDLQKSREIIESLKIAELNNFFRDNCLESQVAKSSDLETRDTQTAIFYPILLKDRIEIIVSLGGKTLKNYKTYLPNSQIDEELKTIIRSLRNEDRDFQPLLKKWYGILISPIEGDLIANKINNLVFVPDGLLRNIPLAALYDGENKKYLVEKYSTALAPSLNLITPQILNPETQIFLAAGLTESPKAPEWSKIPKVKTELENITQRTGSESNLLFNESFTENNLENKLDIVQVSNLHLATHGQFGSTPEDTFLLTWDGAINLNQLEQLLRTEQSKNRVIDLLVLSACETAQGSEKVSLGLAGIAVRAGVRSTIASLWQVSDDSTQQLMTQLYSELTKDPKPTKAEALRQAQLFVLENPKFSHPYYWSAFVLVGNWQ